MYAALRLYANVFLPALKLIDKTWEGSIAIQRSITIWRYSPWTTAGVRLVQHDAIGDPISAALIQNRARRDRALLLHSIRGA